MSQFVLVFPDGGSCSCSDGGVVWRGDTGSHPGPADMWGLLNGKNTGGMKAIYLVTGMC